MKSRSTLISQNRYVWSVVLVCCAWLPMPVRAADFQLDIEQITSGPNHHFFGYIGHVQNIPWNSNGRYIVALRSKFQDHLPKADEAADIVLIDTNANNKIHAVEQTRAWNLQQGTMLYWNPDRPDTQFLFNDRDPTSNHVMTVLYDIKQQRRVKEYRFPDTPIGNGGVAQNGGYYAGINYARLARLRPVTGYPETYDWTIGVNAPTDDGVFKVDIRTGELKLIASFRQMADLLRESRPKIDEIPLFINHTLWNRDGSRIFFFVRGNFGRREARVNVPCTVSPNGTGLTIQKTHIGGHPEWEFGMTMIGRVGPDQVLYDTSEQTVVGKLGDPSIFPKPEGDVALSPNGRWFVNGYRSGSENYYVVYRREDGKYVRTHGFDHRGWTSGPLRLDAAPCWNRTNDEILFTAIAPDKTRQVHRIRIRAR